jgi:hypothetical protein
MPDTKAKQPKTFPERDGWLHAMLAVSPKVLPHAAARLATRIALHVNIDTGQCNPSYKTLAEETGISERSIYRLVELLERIGWLVVERTTGRANHFVLQTPANSMAEVTPANSMAEVDPGPLPNSTPTPAKIGADPCQQVADRTARTAKRTVAVAKATATRERERSRALADPHGALRLEAGAPKDVFAALLSIYKRPPHGDEDEAAGWKAFVVECSKGVPDEIAAAILASGHLWVAAYRDEPNMLKPLWKWLAKGIWKHQPDKKQPKRGQREPSLGEQIIAKYGDRS